VAPTQEDYAAWIGHNVVDTSGAKVGKVASIYVDDETGELNWASVNTGMFGKKSSFVPMEGAQAHGEDLLVAWDKGTVKDAPQVDDDEDGHVSQQQEDELYRYYKVHVGTRTTETGRVRLR
jgi:sporulation protein YlmC with PRC-barrel domain